MPNFREEFMKTKGLPIIYKGNELRLVDELIIKETQKIRVVIESTHSQWRQGVSIGIKKGSIIYNNFDYKQKNKKGFGIDIWADEVHECEIVFKNTDKLLKVWNFWEHEYWSGHKGKRALDMGAAMIVEEIPNGHRYRCNDGEPDEDFDDIIFRIEFLES